MTWNEQVDVNAGINPINGLGESQPMVPLQNVQGEAQMSKEYVPSMATAQAANPLDQQSVAPQIVSQPAVSLASGVVAGMPANRLAPASANPAQTDDDTGADDVVWVNRAKRIIAGTRGDPHRQVQLLQQLSVVYLKERYGRSVHADEV